MRKRFFSFLKTKENILIFAITLGILMMSLGIYIMGAKIHPFLGSRIIIIGSGLFYIGVVILVFVID
ncbi:MAG: hypothetical protein ABEK36_00180 [Candidatus Aenigmatarchaeota archaeon]